jgi:hypothetical protein
MYKTLPYPALLFTTAIYDSKLNAENKQTQQCKPTNDSKRDAGNQTTKVKSTCSVETGWIFGICSQSLPVSQRLVLSCSFSASTLQSL